MSFPAVWRWLARAKGKEPSILKVPGAHKLLSIFLSIDDNFCFCRRHAFISKYRYVYIPRKLWNYKNFNLIFFVRLIVEIAIETIKNFSRFVHCSLRYGKTIAKSLIKKYHMCIKYNTCCETYEGKKW